MKVLLDECVPRKLKNAFPGHECQTVPEAGFAGSKNGRLLALAENAAGTDRVPTAPADLSQGANAGALPEGGHIPLKVDPAEYDSH